MGADKKTDKKCHDKHRSVCSFFCYARSKIWNLTKFCDRDVLGEILDFGSISAQIL